ncbi:GNAT family N-acetyltransferase [Actinobacillus arthritidis]|uniref:GNAT family N-acetyltransferase n=1 Tax=Actinobacillus arthritidis TaxID=157339 RepID=UPI0024426885|nr:GNAT family N-acetyltransferase [Actinobacillus arthritidis]WGE90192.1 N-acetyltransferase [Actinobacillus arthritidis]
MQIIHDKENFEIAYIDQNHQKMGRLRYRYLSDSVIDVFTTKVEAEFQGKGIAGELYKAVIAFAEQNHLKIKPSCSYIDVKMQRTHKDLMA